MKTKRYIAPGSWFALDYPENWNEFEDTEDSFLFYNPEKWSGNFRISAFRGEKNYATECIDYELEVNEKATAIKVGKYDCAYSCVDFTEEGVDYTAHLWITGSDTLSVECSFTVKRGADVKVAEDIIASLQLHGANDKSWKAMIPVRVLEINAINEAYDWAVTTMKKQLTKDFTAQEQDVKSIQKVIDEGKFKKEQRNVWEALGVAFGAILVNEMDGMEWVTAVDGRKEVPALKFADSQIVVYPLELIWNRVKNGEKVNLTEEYARIKDEVETFLQKQ